MKHFVFALTSLVSMLVLGFAEDRAALVIGNNDYTHARKLETAVEDAKAVAAKLETLGFDVFLRTDARHNDFPELVAEFLVEAQDADAVLVYYAGHGMESPALGGNYLIPVDAVLEKESHLESQAYSLNTLLDRLRPLKAPVRLVVLDCCRNNPLQGRAWSSNRGVNGLAAIDLQRLDAATMVVYSASPGKVAKERILPSDVNGPFAQALLQELDQSGNSAFRTFARVEDAVYRLTSEVQRPKTFFSGSLGPFDAFVFLPEGSSITPASPPVMTTTTPEGLGDRQVTPATATKDRPYVNSLGMKFVPVPGTDVLFCIWETRVQDYAAYAAANPGVDMEWKDYEYEGHGQGPDHPVVNVSWDDAQAFCEWLSRKEGLEYRLPTDYEWSVAVGISHLEKASLSPAEKNMGVDHYLWGEGWPPPEMAGNFCDFTAVSQFGMPGIEGYNDGAAFTAPVGTYKVESNGIYDLAGSVWEWCQDYYGQSKQTRVLRGGSWANRNLHLVASYRAEVAADDHSMRDGFRCVFKVNSVN